MPTAYPRPVSTTRSSGKTVLRVMGTPAASVERYTGGEPYCDVINEPGGLLPYAKKHLGPLKFADLEAQVAMDAHPTLFRWIRDSWFGSPERDKVSFETGDASRSIELSNARLREVVLPALDYDARDRRFLTLRISPRGLRRTQASSDPTLDRSEREFLAHNFAVQIDGLDCSGVLAVDSFAIKVELPPDGVRKKPQLVFPDLHIYLDASKADAFREWFEDFVISGNNDDDREREGSIAYQDPMLGEPLAVLQIKHLGIFRIVDEPPPPKGPRRVRADLYCERMELTSNETSGAGDTQPLAPVNV